MPSSENNYPGAASLIQDIGSSLWLVAQRSFVEKMAIIVRGGRVFIGFLRIIDQFGKISYPIYISVGNVVLHNAVERIHVAKKFCDVPQGILLIRGENITIIGELVR